MKQRNVIMFAGKGGVGKTTCTAATALHHSLQGKKTLTISTDPTPSLGHIFEVGRRPGLTRVRENLFVHEIGIAEIQKMWDTKFGKEVYDVFSSFVDIKYDDFVEFMSSVLPGMRDEFTVDYIHNLAHSGDYDVIIWDTAPLGQTLGLLGMPALLRKHLKSAPRIYSTFKLGGNSRKSILEILKGWEEISGRDMDFLKQEVGFNIVTIPEMLAVEQLDEIFGEFDRYDLPVSRLIINNVIEDEGSDFLVARSKRQHIFIKTLKNKFDKIQLVEMPMFSEQITGLGGLELFRQKLFAR
jgi:arsenite/tail-anchored protein-transporting ATPase